MAPVPQEVEPPPNPGRFRHVKVRYRGLAKNTAQLHTLMALANLWLIRRKWIAVMA